MSESVQFVASRSGELGVQSQYLDGELHLVDDALAGRLFFNPQLKIIYVVVQAIAIFVVDVFTFIKFALEFFRHHYSMLKIGFSPAEVQSPVPGGVNVPFVGYGTPRASFVSTFSAAKFLAFVVARMTTVFGLHQAAFFRNATQLALKSRDGFLVHEGQLLDSSSGVNGVFRTRNPQIITYTGG
jgi:hypothetical protein